MPVRRVDDAREAPNESVRLAALSAIARTRSKKALARLDAVKKDPSPKIRAERARALPVRDALRLVEALADDTAKEVRACALVTLLARADEYSIVAFGRLWPKTAADNTRREVARGGPRGRHRAARPALGECAVQRAPRDHRDHDCRARIEGLGPQAPACSARSGPEALPTGARSASCGPKAAPASPCSPHGLAASIALARSSAGSSQSAMSTVRSPPRVTRSSVSSIALHRLQVRRGWSS